MQSGNPEIFPFFCNICGQAAEGPLDRDTYPGCCHCKSTGRFRAVVRVLSESLFGEALNLRDFPSLPLKGIGLTDWWGYAETLMDRFDYQPTYYDHEPKLDITNPPAELYGTLDFLISSDVFEHVEPPIEPAFKASFHLLKPGGLFLLTVPYSTKRRNTVEHFPSLHDWEIIDAQGGLRVLNWTIDGKREVFGNPHFHGGEGVTLEMRQFAEAELLALLERTGFRDVTVWEQQDWEGSGFPITARRPRAVAQP